MVFNNAIPQPSDILSQSQVDLLNNFAAIGTQFGTDLGFHILNNQATDPTTSASQLAAYAKTIGSNIHFTIQPVSETNADGKTRIQMDSYNALAPLGGGGNGPNLFVHAAAGGNPPINGCTFLPCAAGSTFAPNGLLLQFGIATSS